LGRSGLGIHLPNGGFLDMKFSYLKKVAVEAEEQGYDSIWVADHLIYPESLGPSNIYEPLTTLAALSSTTSSIVLGTSVLLPLRHPLVIAKMLSTLDHASNGRIVLGIGAGWYKPEFDAVAVPFDRRGEIEEETIVLLGRLLTEGNASFSGKHFRAEDLSLNPKPIQKPRPRIWIGGGVQKTFERIAKYGDGWLSWSPTPETFSCGISRIRKYCRVFGRDTSKIEFAADFVSCVKKDGEVARREAERMHLRKENSIIGNPEECLEQIDEYVRLGADHIILGFKPYGQEIESMKMIMEEID